MIKIFIIDDHKILIDSFADHFKKVEDIELVGYALSGCEAIEALNPNEMETIPDIILQDIDLKDMTGIECTKSLMKINPNLKIIGVSSYTEKVIVQKLMKVGAKGYISKSTDINNLESAVLTHRKNLLLKFGVKSSVGLIRKAIEFGMLKE